jgi:hypothetical protein
VWTGHGLEALAGVILAYIAAVDISSFDIISRL